MITKFTDRSRIETYQRCARLRWLSYHEQGLGLSPAKESLPLAVGKSVHKGLEMLLLHATALVNGADPLYLEDTAVAAALADFAPHRRQIALDLAEESARAATMDLKDAGLEAQLVATAADLGMDPADPALASLLERQRNAGAEFDDWLWQEQAALVEGMVRAYARRRLRPLLEEFEVLEVEREGDWELAAWDDEPTFNYTEDVRKARDAEHDMQGLSEGVEVERRLGEWWAAVHLASEATDKGTEFYDPKEHDPALNIPENIHRYLTSIPAPPRILGIRYEYLLKGARYADKDLSARFGLNVWARSLRFMSRPDALLRSRADNSLYLLSYKTAASWDVRKARDAEHDMQGLSEGVEVERRLGQWWTVLHGTDKHNPDLAEIPIATQNYLASIPAPPRILGIRYEYLLKGARYADRDLSSRFGLNVWAQRSHLIRAYHNDSMIAPESRTTGSGFGNYVGAWCWSYDHLKDDGSTSKLYYKTWRPRAVWESMPIRRWIDMLDTATMAMSAYDSTVGMEPREMGWKSDAQAQGYTTQHPLDEVFPAPLTVYRQDDQLRDFVEQIEAQETRVAKAVAQVEGAADDGEKRHLLNVLFPMHRRSCSYPSECAMTRVCYGGEDAQRDPMATGAYKQREPHHTPEKYAHDLHKAESI